MSFSKSARFVAYKLNSGNMTLAIFLTLSNSELRLNPEKTMPSPLSHVDVVKSSYLLKIPSKTTGLNILFNTIL